jgi:hypothetical protein
LREPVLQASTRFSGIVTHRGGDRHNNAAKFTWCVCEVTAYP